MKDKKEYHGNLYQLRYKYGAYVGATVAINGPYDTIGRVLKLKDTNKEGTLCLVRGIG